MNELQIPNCYYRVSIKALILNETRDKFLITKEDNGMWELPGGGLDHGETPHSDLPREISEEMGLKVTSVANHPSYFFSCAHKGRPNAYIINVLYETTVENLDFTPSDECTDIAFINKENAHEYDLFPNVPILVEQFDPKRHEDPQI